MEVMDPLSDVYEAISKLRSEMEKVKDGQAKSRALTKIDKAEAWLDLCEPKDELWKPASEQ